MKTFGEFYASYFGSPYLPHGLSKSDMVMTGDGESTYEQCKYFQNHGAHLWRCSDCDKTAAYDEEQGKHIEHEDCLAPIYCIVCDILEDGEFVPASND